MGRKRSTHVDTSSQEGADTSLGPVDETTQEGGDDQGSQDTADGASQNGAGADEAPSTQDGAPEAEDSATPADDLPPGPDPEPLLVVTAVQLVRPHGYLDEDGRHRFWPAGQVVTDEGDIEVLLARRADVLVETEFPA